MEGLLGVERELVEADSILGLEDEISIEGNVAKMARQQLAQVRLAIQGLRAAKF